MQSLYFAAGSVALITGIVHSVLGEMLIFKHLRNGGFIPSIGAPPLREKNIRILWATWHLASAFGWAFAGILFWLAFKPQDSALIRVVLSAIVLANLGGSGLVLIGTKGRHPGWIALLTVAVLTALAARAS